MLSKENYRTASCLEGFLCYYFVQQIENVESTFITLHFSTSVTCEDQ